MSNSLDPDQARQIVEPDLGPNCLPRLSADDTGRQRVKEPSENTLFYKYKFYDFVFQKLIPLKYTNHHHLKQHLNL